MPQTLNRPVVSTRLGIPCPFVYRSTSSRVRLQTQDSQACGLQSHRQKSHHPGSLRLCRTSYPPALLSTRLQQFSSSGQETAMFRVVYCFSFYREVHTALRSMVKLGHGDHEESQVHDLWLEDDYFSLTKFCSFIGDQSQIRSSCEKKSDAVFCGFCESTNHVVFNCPRKASVRSVFAFLSLKHMIASGY